MRPYQSGLLRDKIIFIQSQSILRGISGYDRLTWELNPDWA
ncbi:hypothetical protein B0G85_1611 [Polynucleobacter brandtiae]|uniref:Uncharacterized protein n=1 Tax=Polynucleobacter brandtiae TaxID=1938816 RepID=A0A2M8VQQ8_9BURK|nr:hypothetical protein B0G85_1611 [Polynucleobacter brandtiae]